MVVTRHSGRWTLEDRFSSAWHYLPFEVSAGACAIRVELEYERSGAVMDLGCLGAGGFRGWSGGVRRSYVIGPDAATPGYLPGEPEPGLWQVMIGLHRVPPGGADYTVTIDVSSSPGELRPDAPPEPMPALAERPAPRILPASAGRRWLAGDLHTHTVHSDGVMTVPELARFAAGRGMEFLAVTDHNTTSHHRELPGAAAEHGIVLLPGQEVTTESGHAGALGDVGWIDFREPPDSWLEACEEAGGLLSINHPYGGQVSWAAPMKRRPPLLEVWHWSWLDTRVDHPVRLVAGLGSGRHPGRRQRLAPARQRCPARRADHVGGGRGRRPGRGAGGARRGPHRSVSTPRRPGAAAGRRRAGRQRR